LLQISSFNLRLKKLTKLPNKFRKKIKNSLKYAPLATSLYY